MVTRHRALSRQVLDLVPDLEQHDGDTDPPGELKYHHSDADQ